MAKAHILLTRRWPEEVEAHLESRFAVTRNAGDRPLGADELRAAMSSCDALCPTVTDTIDKDILDVPDRRVWLIANYGVGFNHIDVDACRTLGIAVTNTPDVLTDATADLTLTLILMASRRAGEGERLARSGQWQGWAPTQMLGRSLAGKTLGLVGLGRIGQAVARRAAAFGMTITYHARRRLSPDLEREIGAAFVADLDGLVALSDIVSLHCPGGRETHHLIDQRRLALMKPTAILINTARGTVVAEAALADALKAGRIAAAGLDVYELEPEIDPALRELENVVLLPHLGSATHETRVAMGMRVAANLEAWFEGRAPRDRVV